MSSLYYKRFILLFQICIIGSGVFSADLSFAQSRPEPEQQTGYYDALGASGKEIMAVTANPHATHAAYDVLKGGGNAIDAAIAAQLVLGLVEPQSSGLGGGAFILYYDNDKDQLYSYDGREKSPDSVTESLFLDENKKPMKFHDAVIGGRSVGVPGTPALLEYVHQRHGAQSWDNLFDHAIDLSNKGFVVSDRLRKMIEHDRGRLDRFDNAREYFYIDTKPRELLKNPDYAETLIGFRDHGSAYLYDIHSPSNIVEDIVRVVSFDNDNPGFLSPDDLSDYTIVKRAPVCGLYRGYKVCSMGEPSSGGLTLLLILGMLERFDLSAGPTAKNIHLVSEASRLAFLDRNKYMADPDMRNTSSLLLLDPVYINSRADLINPEKKREDVDAGKPDKERGTSHISIRDSLGNVVSMTTTIEGAFGSKLMVKGFLLNNELTDFNFEPGHANSVEGDKRPRSSMSPTIVFKDNKPFLVIGSAGGSRIIGYVLQRLIALIDWDMELKEAIDMPHFLTRSDTIELDPEYMFMGGELESYGHKLDYKEMNSGLTAILIKDNFLLGVADPRREGVAQGE
jgi:gamma-glutamyltranspeptidase/glutathione hydrolase